MRYLPLTDEDRRAMLAEVGVASIDELFRDVPPAARLAGPIEGLPDHQSEPAVEQAFLAFARRNLSPATVPSFLGAGAYRHHIPATVDHLIQRGEFLTAYTPYQPEVAQGTLQYLFEFQTQVALLTEMDVANASLYDGATATAEAVLMAARITKRSRVVMSGGLHPHYADVVDTNGRFMGLDIRRLPPSWRGDEDAVSPVNAETACVVVQNPDVFGRVHDYRPLAAACREVGALLIVVVTEIISLGLIEPPGAMGADIVAAEGQSLGNAPSFGGPTVGLFATREKFLRQMPGRLVGETVDVDSRRGFVLTLSTREQHIRREKATSNICTNSGLCALAFTIHLTLLGELGYARLAEINHATAVRLAEGLGRIAGLDVVTEAFFNEITVRLPRPAAEVVEILADRGILAGVPVSRLFPGIEDMAPLLLMAASELTTPADIEAVATAFEDVLR
jgi:glycine dehydrogenase subunit 1